MKWINVKNKDDKKESLPAWGAWIEILIIILLLSSVVVAPRMGGVD